MERQPEAQNLLVDFEETPDAPEPPDIGIAVRVWPTEVKPGEPVFLAGAYSADGELMIHCEQNVAACIVLTLVRLTTDGLEKMSLPLIQPIVKAKPPPAGPFSPYYRQSAQFKVDLSAFFDLPATPAVYSIEATVGRYTSGPQSFRVAISLGVP